MKRKEFINNIFTCGFKEDNFEGRHICITINVFSVTGIILFLIFVIRSLIESFFVMASIDFFMAIVLICNMLFLQKTKKYIHAGIILSVLMGIFILSLYHIKELEYLGPLYAYLYPPLVFFILGRKKGLYFTITMLIIIILFSYFLKFLPYYTAVYTKLQTQTHIYTYIIELIVCYVSAKVMERNNQEIFQKSLEIVRLNEGMKIDIEKRINAENQLKSSNRELEQFAYIASHDLQEPLRKITSFGERLKDRNTGKLDEKSIDYLSRMQNASKRMQSLINGLLSYSRVTTKAAAFKQVDLNQTMNNIIDDLEIQIREINGQINMDKMPVIIADPLQMSQLFQNLISNALKYHKENVSPVINIKSKVTEDEKRKKYLEISIADNGIGFEEKYSEKIFEVFQRLVGKSEYEGSGIGLSICKKIVERHNGQISVKSKKGEGSVFKIHLPVKE